MPVNPRDRSPSAADARVESTDLFGAPQRDTRPLLDWRHAMRIVRRRAWPAATVALIVFVAAVARAFTQVPVYEAKARILIEAERGNPAGLKDPLEEAKSDVTDFQTQLMILQSRSLARATMQGLGIWDPPSAAPQSTVEPAAPAPGSFRAFLVAIRDAAHGISSWLWEPQASAGAVASRTDTSESASESNRINGFLGGLRVAPVSATRLVDVYYTSADRHAATRNVNALVTNFIRENAEARMTASKDVINWLNERLAEQRIALEASEAALHQYRAQHNVVSVDEQSSLSVQKLTELTGAAAKAKTDRIEKEAMLKQLESERRSGGSLEAFPAVLANPAVQQVRSELLSLQQQEAQIAQRLGDKNPTLIKVRDQMKGTQARLQVEISKVANSVRTDFEAARATEASLSQALEAQKRDTLSHNGNDVEMVLLQRDAESNRQIWQSLQQRVNEFSVTREHRTSNVRIVDAAEVPQMPLGETVRRDLRYGALGSLFLGLCVAFCLEYFDSRIKTPEQIKTELGVPFLGMVPLAPQQKNAALSLLVSTAASQPGVPPGFGEAFRKLRTNVRLSLPDEGMQPLLITSAAMGEGKTLVASNLATTLALANYRVLLIDADLRRPRLHKVFGLSQEPGLSNLIVGQTPPQEAIRKTAVSGLRLVTSGTLPPNPSELLESRRFKEFLSQLGKYFDWVLIDSPPLLPVTDAMVLAQDVAGVILVVSADVTPIQAARSSIDQLDTARARMLGAVLNRVDLQRRAYYYADHYREEDERYYRRSSARA